MRLTPKLSEVLRASPGAVLDDYLVIETGSVAYLVSVDMALRVRIELDSANAEPVEFIDLYGALHRVLPGDVRRISEPEPGSRASLRALPSERRGEADVRETVAAK